MESVIVILVIQVYLNEALVAFLVCNQEHVINQVYQNVFVILGTGDHCQIEILRCDPWDIYTLE